MSWFRGVGWCVCWNNWTLWPVRAPGSGPKSRPQALSSSQQRLSLGCFCARFTAWPNRMRAVPCSPDQTPQTLCRRISRLDAQHSGGHREARQQSQPRRRAAAQHPEQEAGSLGLDDPAHGQTKRRCNKELTLSGDLPVDSDPGSWKCNTGISIQDLKQETAKRQKARHPAPLAGREEVGGYENLPGNSCGKFCFAARESNPGISVAEIPRRLTLRPKPLDHSAGALAGVVR